MGLSDVPMCTAPKTLYSEHRHGLGLLHIRTAWAQRTLDMASRAMRPLQDPQQARRLHFLLHHLLNVQHTAAASVGAYTDPSLPVGVGPDHPLSNCVVQQIQPPPTPLETTYSDGSWDGKDKCAAAVVTSKGNAYLLRPAGRASAYKAEVFGLALATEVAPPGDTIRTDSLAAILAVRKDGRVVHGNQIALIPSNLRSKGLALQYVRGHCGETGNEMVDQLSKEANATLPDQRDAANPPARAPPPPMGHPQRQRIGDGAP